MEGAAEEDVKRMYPDSRMYSNLGSRMSGYEHGSRRRQLNNLLLSSASTGKPILMIEVSHFRCDVCVLCFNYNLAPYLSECNLLTLPDGGPFLDTQPLPRQL